MPLKPYHTNKESLLPIFEIYLNKPQEIFVFNSNLKRNKDLDDWVQLPVHCSNCGWTGVERLIGQGYEQHFIEIDHQKLLRESYPVRCPFCLKAWQTEITREFSPETLALSVDDDLNKGLTELDDEIKGERE